MKTKMFFHISGCAALLLISSACDQQPKTETQTQKPPEAVSSNTSKALDTVQAGAQQAVNQAATQAPAAEAQTQGLIDKAKALIADQKYQDALSSLNRLATAKLTPDQQKIVDDLKAKIQAALAKASGIDVPPAVGGALGGKQ